MRSSLHHPSIHRPNLMWPKSQDAPSQVTSASTSAQTNLPIPQAQASTMEVLQDLRGKTPRMFHQGLRVQRNNRVPKSSLGARPKIKRPPKAESRDYRSFTNRYHALEMDFEYASGSESDQYDRSHFT